MSENEPAVAALIVIDVQAGFDDPVWGPTANLEAERNISRLLDAWQHQRRGPIIVVRHDSIAPASPLRPANPGNALKPEVARADAALLVVKQVNSAFYGTPDLQQWLDEHAIHRLVLCGIQTNMCVETTARMAGNLGYDVTVALDATRTFDLAAEIPGVGEARLAADQLVQTSAVNLAAGGFAHIASTEQILAGSHA